MLFLRIPGTLATRPVSRSEKRIASILIVAGADRPLYTLEVDPSNGTWASFGVVNTGGLWEMKFSIDEHPLYVYGNGLHPSH